VREALAAYFAKNRDALSDQSKERLDRNPMRILDSKDPKDRALVAAAPQMHELLCAEDREHFDQVIAGVERLGHRYKVSQTLVRGLDYYTRTVVECVLTDPEFTKAGDIAVAAGGRYNDLVQTLGGPPVQGVGIAGGVDVLYEALKKEGVRMGHETEADVYVLSAEKGDGADRLQIADPLRQAGFNVAIDYSDRSLDKQLESAVKHGAKVAVIRGTPEARGGNVIVRDLIKKEQRITRLAAVVTEVGRHVPKHATPPLFDGPPPNPDEQEPGAAGEGPFLKDDRD
jgi:histidyl-tRNA synthetase